MPTGSGRLNLNFHLAPAVTDMKRGAVQRPFLARKPAHARHERDGLGGIEIADGGTRVEHQPAAGRPLIRSYERGVGGDNRQAGRSFELFDR